MEETAVEVVEAVVPALELVTPELLLMVLGGALVTLLGGLLKGPLKKFSPKLVVTVVALLVGAAYYGFNSYVPADLKMALADFVTGSLAFAVLIYEFIYKSLKKK